jgi:hypothetical protein
MVLRAIDLLLAEKSLFQVYFWPDFLLNSHVTMEVTDIQVER